AQPHTNLEVINSLIDNSTEQIAGEINSKTVEFFIDYKSPAEFSFLNEQLISGLTKNNIKINVDTITTGSKIIYSLSDAGVFYSDIFRSGLFGGYLIERKFKLSGSYIIEKNGSVTDSESFNLTKTDTIDYDFINIIETPSLTFTQGNIPSQPFFPSIIEPLIAITAVAITVILFFTVRSK
ncbi:MAG: hypothetical protein KAQ90_01025, partial [Melioribacteraceae bacterium]|nr:hypothetical protein [Melioribacteraceae bacterium]